MRTPPPSHQTKFNKKNLPIIPVVVDPFIGRHLRPHQIEGVKVRFLPWLLFTVCGGTDASYAPLQFLYKAMTGQLEENYYG